MNGVAVVQESKAHVAGSPPENMFSETRNSWLVSEACTVTIDLGKAVIVENIFVANDGAGLLEVAGRVESEEWLNLLGSSLLMKPNEPSALNLVRWFQKELNMQTRGVAVDRLKISVSQPYVSTSQFGLGYLELNISQERFAFLKQFFAGRCALQNQPQVEEEIEVKEQPKPLPPVKAAPPPKPAPPPPPTSAAKGSAKKRVRHDDEDDDDENFVEVIGNVSTPKNAKRGDSSSTPTTSVSAKRAASASSSSSSSSPLAGVTFVLSGFENPLRANLREMAVSLGARYSQDWTRDCTHLVLAFEGTPKHRDMLGSGHGCVVKSSWIEECSRKATSVPEELHGFAHHQNSLPLNRSFGSSPAMSFDRSNRNNTTREEDNIIDLLNEPTENEEEEF